MRKGDGSGKVKPKKRDRDKEYLQAIDGQSGHLLVPDAKLLAHAMEKPINKINRKSNTRKDVTPKLTIPIKERCIEQKESHDQYLQFLHGCLNTSGATIRYTGKFVQKSHINKNFNQILDCFSVVNQGVDTLISLAPLLRSLEVSISAEVPDSYQAQTLFSYDAGKFNFVEAMRWMFEGSPWEEFLEFYDNGVGGLVKKGVVLAKDLLNSFMLILHWIKVLPCYRFEDLKHDDQDTVNYCIRDYGERFRDIEEKLNQPSAPDVTSEAAINHRAIKSKTVVVSDPDPDPDLSDGCSQSIEIREADPAPDDLQREGPVVCVTKNSKTNRFILPRNSVGQLMRNHPKKDHPCAEQSELEAQITQRIESLIAYHQASPTLEQQDHQNRHKVALGVALLNVLSQSNRNGRPLHKLTINYLVSSIQLTLTAAIDPRTVRLSLHVNCKEDCVTQIFNLDDPTVAKIKKIYNLTRNVANSMRSRSVITSSGSGRQKGYGSGGWARYFQPLPETVCLSERSISRDDGLPGIMVANPG